MSELFLVLDNTEFAWRLMESVALRDKSKKRRGKELKAEAHARVVLSCLVCGIGRWIAEQPFSLFAGVKDGAFLRLLDDPTVDARVAAAITRVCMYRRHPWEELTETHSHMSTTCSLRMPNVCTVGHGRVVMQRRTKDESDGQRLTSSGSFAGNSCAHRSQHRGVRAGTIFCHVCIAVVCIEPYEYGCVCVH